MTGTVVAVFVATYLGMAVGRVPGLKLDRTGIALLALTVLLAVGALDLGAVGAAIDAPTIVLLFALMILSAQFAAAGFYDLCARAITRATATPERLAMTVMIAGALSAVLANDIVVYAMTPLLCAGIGARRLDPRPFLIALAGASNAGSAATLIGNPQNILIGQIGGLDFWRFILACGVPAVLSLLIVYLTVRWIWRAALTRPGDGPGDPPPTLPAPVPIDRWQVAKGAAATILLIGLFATPLPREIGALAIAAALLASRKLASRAMIGAVDWHLLLLFACLFSITAAFAGTALATDGLEWLSDRGLLPDSLAVLAPLALAMSNTIGNVPAVILLMAVWPSPPEGALYGLALLSTLAGNLLLVGSLANIIVAERAAAAGVRLGFLDFARAGIPMTILSMGLAVAWLGIVGLMPWR